MSNSGFLVDSTTKMRSQINEAIVHNIFVLLFIKKVALFDLKRFLNKFNLQLASASPSPYQCN